MREKRGLLQGISAQLIEFNIGEDIQHSLIAEGVCRNSSSSRERRVVILVISDLY
jgi:hypothetical protein